MQNPKSPIPETRLPPPYSERLVNLLVPAEEVAALKAYANKSPSLQLPAQAEYSIC